MFVNAFDIQRYRLGQLSPGQATTHEGEKPCDRGQMAGRHGRLGGDVWDWGDRGPTSEVLDRGWGGGNVACRF